MKSLKLFIGIVTAIVTVSCSNDNTESTEDPNLMTLNKTIRYYPEQANYQTKIVGYYSNNEISTDSTFNNLNTLSKRNIWVNTGLTRTKTTYDNNNTITNTSEEHFDNSGRLIRKVETAGASSLTYQYIYNSDNSISSGYLNSSSQFILFKTYLINSDGLIYEEIDNSNNDNVSTITFNSSIPIEISEAGLIFTYFNNTKPSNLLNTDAQINNAVLRESRLYRVADNCDKYLKGYDGFGNSTATFNENNYITYKRNTSFDNTVMPAVEVPSFETFYYYN